MGDGFCFLLEFIFDYARDQSYGGLGHGVPLKFWEI
jgi:hypothetical protein